MKKNYFFLMITLICASSIYAQEKVSMLSETSQNQSALMYSSPNGKYAVGYSNGFSLMYVADENKTYYYGDLDEESGMMTAAYIFRGVNDKGEIACSFSGDDLTNTVPGIFKENKFTPLEVPENAIGLAFGISENGTVIGAYQKPNDVHQYYPCVWRNGKLTTLKFPMKDLFNREETGAVAYQISADGKVISGAYINGDGYDWIPAIWKNDDEECTLPCLDFMYNLDKPVTLTFPDENDYIHAAWGEPGYDEEQAAFNAALEAYYQQCSAFRKQNLLDGRITMSPNGKYLGTTNLRDDKKRIPVIIDVETEQLEEISEFDNAVLLSVTNGRNVSFATPYFEIVRTTYLYFSDSKESFELRDYIQNKFDFDILDDESGISSICDFTSSGSVVCDATGKSFYGYLGGSEIPVYNCAIHLPESIDKPDGIYSAKNAKEGITYSNGELKLGNNAEQITVFNTNGAIVFQSNNIGSSIQVNLPAGIYAVKSISNGNSNVSKIVVK